MDVSKLAGGFGGLGGLGKALGGMRDLPAPGTPGSPVDGATTLGGDGVGGGPGAAGGASFGAMLNDSLSQVNALQHDADVAIQDLASGGPTSLHDTMIALEKAENSFKLMMQVRNKIVEAYHEVLRMQV